MKHKRILFIAGLLELLFPFYALAQKPSLQELFDAPSTRASGEVIDVDLSEWQSEYTTTLTVKGGRRYRFYNGTISGTSEMGTGPLLYIIEDSEYCVY